MENTEIIEYAKKMSQDILNRGEEIMPMCLIFKKSGNIEIIGMQFSGENSKEHMRNELKKYIVNKDIEKYAMIMDAKMTAMDRENKLNTKGKVKAKPIVTDVVLISVYSAQDKLTRSFPYYEDKQLLDNEESITITGRKDTHDAWDIWGEEVQLNDDFNKDYQKFKNENRGLYKGLDKDEDDIYEIKTRGKLQTIQLPLKFHMDIYRYKKQAIFEAFNAQGKKFFATGAMDDDKVFEEKMANIKDMLTKLGADFERRK